MFAAMSISDGSAFVYSCRSVQERDLFRLMSDVGHIKKDNGAYSFIRVHKK